MRNHKNKREFTLHNLLLNNSPFSWRSLFAFVVSTILSTALLWVGKLEPTHWVEVIMWIGGFFITGETAKKFAKKRDEVVEESKSLE
jgi:hypothetical protein